MRRCRSAEATVLALAAAAAAVAAPPSPLSPPQGFAEVDRLLDSIGESDLRIDLLAGWHAAGTAREAAAERERLHRRLMEALRRYLRSASLAEGPQRLARAEALLAVAGSESERAALRREIALFKSALATAEAAQWRERSRFDPQAEDAASAIARLVQWLEESAVDLAAESLRSSREGRGEGGRVAGEAADAARAAERARWQLLAGWAWLERARLDGSVAAAARAEELLLPLLEAGVPDPRPVEISLDLRADPGFSRAILGVALARTLDRSLEEGLAWLRLLDAPTVDRRLREERPVWAIELHLLAEDPEGVLQRLDRWDEAEGGAVPVSVLRRCAAAAIDRMTLDSRWAPVATRSLLALLDREAYAEVVRLVGDSDDAGAAIEVDPRAGDRGWDARFVQAAVSALRAVGRGAAPGEVSDRLEQVAAMPGAPPRAVGGLLLLALEQRLVEAAPIGSALATFDRERFAGLSGAAQARAAWWEVAALQRAAIEGSRPAEAWRGAAEELLERFPDHPARPVVRLQLDGERMSPREIAAAVRGDAGPWQATLRAQAIDLLLAGVRGGGATQRRAAAEALLELLPETPGWEDPPARLAAVEAQLALARTGADRAGAAALLDAPPPGWAVDDRGDLVRRLTILRAMAALAAGDLVAAEIAWRQGEPRSPLEWLGLLVAAWQAEPERLDLADAIALQAEARGDAAGLALAAAAAAWREAPTSVRAERWLAIALAVEASTEESQRGGAMEQVAAAAAAARSWAVVLERARRLLTLYEPGSDAWLDAKRFQLEALENLDPQRASAVLRQHQGLRPQWREQRHGAWFEALGERLGGAAVATRERLR